MRDHLLTQELLDSVYDGDGEVGVALVDSVDVGHELGGRMLARLSGRDRAAAESTYALDILEGVASGSLLGLEQIIVGDVEILHGRIGLCLSLHQGVQVVVCLLGLQKSLG